MPAGAAGRFGAAATMLSQSRRCMRTAASEINEMGVRNYLIEGVSGAGKTAVADELQRRGYHVVHGDRELAYRGDPTTGKPVDEPADERVADRSAWVHAHHIWDVGKVRAMIVDRRSLISFFCGGCRNLPRFVDWFDAVFELDVDLDTLKRRLAARPEDEFGGRPAERGLIMRLHATKEDVPKHAQRIDATAPLAVIVDEILSKCGEAEG